MANLKYFLWLTNCKGLQPGDPGRLLAHFGTPEAVYFAEREEYDLLGLPQGKKRALEDKSLAGVERILADCDRLGIHIMTIQDADYPERLAQICDPPCVLYWRGKPLGVDEHLSVGVVGTRKCTPYGEALAGKLGGGGQNGPAGVLSLELAALLIIHVDPSLTNKMEMI